MFKLGKMVTDKASGVRGCLTHMQVEGGPGNYARFYNFQPAMLHAEDGTPAEKTWITESRIEGETCPEPSDLPLSSLGTYATDTITGFSGIVTAVTLHINGCVHLHLQPKGTHPKTGKTLASYDFDIRVLTGPAIPVMSEPDKERDQKRRPSPVECAAFSPVGR